jgi:hypothetical protein
MLLLFWGGVSHADQSSQQKKLASSAGPQQDESISLQRDRLELDRQKLASDAKIEKEKLEIEREKLKVEKSSAKLSAMSLIIPLLVALATVGYGIWSFRKQAQLQFESKAAEIAFSGKTPEAVLRRAKALKAIFPNRLPGNFTGLFDPKEYGGGREDPEGKKFFLELLLKYPDMRTEIGKLWEELFTDEWLTRVKPLLQAKPEAPKAGQDRPTTPSADCIITKILLPFCKKEYI